MTKILGKKWLILLALLSVFIFFGRTVHINSLSDSALILAMGVDFGEGGYSVCVQTTTPTGTSSETTSDSYATFTADSNSIGGALAVLSEKMGLNVTLSHCNILIFSKSVLDKGINEMLENLSSVWFLTMKTVIIATELSPYDVLLANSPETTATSFYLQSILMKSDEFSHITRLSIKDYLVDYYSTSCVSSAALLEMKKLPNDSVAMPDTGGDNIPYYDFFLSKNYVFGKDIEGFVISKEYAEVINFFHSENFKGNITVNIPNGSIVQLEVTKTDAKLKFENYDVSASLKFNAVLHEYITKDGSISLKLVTEEQKFAIADELAAAITQRLTDVFITSQQKNADVFHISCAAKQSSSRGWQKPDDFLQRVNFLPEVEFTLKKG